ncbi:hypothetical protein NDU88_005937 [Pleurodeles waltl]|uniref:Uncharacterized protein n=1 Tax=Pleurodeles waltl TaxID=8319 RepID=A0AAV7NXY9_PLEWA|nr:hypothetical protein NDU88_005937 [Pleurodeles waltl]
MEAGPRSRGHSSCRLSRPSHPSRKEPIKGPTQRPIGTREKHETATRPSTHAEAQQIIASPPPSWRKQGQQTSGGAAPSS